MGGYALLVLCLTNPNEEFQFWFNVRKRISKKEEDELVGAEARCLLANETKKSPSWLY